MTTPPRESSINELKALTILDKEDISQLTDRISELRIAMEEGTSAEVNNLDLTEHSSRDITANLVDRMEAIAKKGENQDATDREMLQALNERLWECDRKSSKLAELRDLQLSIRSSTQKPFGVFEESKHDDDSTETKKTVAPEHKIHEEGSASKHSDHADDMNDSENEYSDSVYSQDEYEPKVDKNAWPLLYQIMDIDPGTSKADIGRLLNRNLERLAMKHSPEFLPNDSTALTRWPKVTRAFDILSNPEKRLYYDSHGTTLPEFENIDPITLEKIPASA